MSISILDLKGKERELARLMLVNRMRPRRIGSHPAWPIELLGTPEQATAFLDLLYAKIPNGRLCVIVGNLGNEVPQPGLRANNDLAEGLRAGRGFIQAKANGEIAVVEFKWDSQTRMIVCNFSYTAKGLTIFRNSNTQVIDVKIDILPELIVEQSLYKLYQLTGNSNFMQVLGERKRMLAQEDNYRETIAVDPRQYYAVLGLNPYIARMMSSEMIASMIKAIKRGIVKLLHGDVTESPSPAYEDYLKAALEAASFLEDEQKREEYTNWL